MPWQCRMLTREEFYGRPMPDRAVGDTTLMDPTWADRHRDIISPEYFRDWYGKRPTVAVVLPGPVTWCVDNRATVPGSLGLGSGWQVTGEPPNLSLHPSVNLKGRWHGWITNGIISDDVDGRRFDAQGSPLT